MSRTRGARLKLKITPSNNIWAVRNLGSRHIVLKPMQINDYLTQRHVLLPSENCDTFDPVTSTLNIFKLPTTSAEP